MGCLCWSCFRNRGVNVASTFRVIRPYLHRVRRRNRGIVGGRRVTVSHACKKHPPSNQLGCPRQQCVYHADCTEMERGGLWGRGNCITNNSRKVKSERHKAPTSTSPRRPKENTGRLRVFISNPVYIQAFLQCILLWPGFQLRKNFLLKWRLW